MLLEYNQTFEKIALDLLATIHPIYQASLLKETVQHYEKDPDHQWYVWILNEQVVGLLGIEVHGYTFTVNHLVVHSSYRNKGIGHAMIEGVQHMQEPRAMTSSEETKQFLAKCWRNLFEQHPVHETLP